MTSSIKPFVVMKALYPSLQLTLFFKVKGDRIDIYAVDEAEALTVLSHEVIDYCVS